MHEDPKHTNRAARRIHLGNWFVELRYSGTKAVSGNNAEDTPESDKGHSLDKCGGMTLFLSFATSSTHISAFGKHSMINPLEGQRVSQRRASGGRIGTFMAVITSMHSGLLSLI